MEAITPSTPPEDTTAALSLNHPWLVALKETLAKPNSSEEALFGDYAYQLDDDGSEAQLTDELPSDRDNGGAVALDPPANVTAVSNAADLSDALVRSALDIVITQHIDLRGMETDFISFALTVGANTRSIRVRFLSSAMHLMQLQRDSRRLLSIGNCSEWSVST